MQFLCLGIENANFLVFVAKIIGKKYQFVTEKNNLEMPGC